jgi:hypothetical protein
MKYLCMKDEEAKNALSFGGPFSIGCGMNNKVN